ncbi:HNH endonuclease, partial [Nocardioides sp. Soil805]|uniref:HNH endonuclease n=1 Tax=Nocardioides sp. Soil805 TaxID=1736416 RepID=UPI00138F7446
TEPGYLPGAGYLPASITRRLAAASAGHTRSTLQRLFAAPTSSYFRHALADLIDLRDRRCRTPYCNAPLRHHDHVIPRNQGGRTTSDNGQGLCEACNYAKETPGWHHRPIPDPLATTQITLTTPTGHQHHSRAPDPPVTGRHTSPAERKVAHLLLHRAA